MSTHRYPCPARPPRGPFDQCGHRHSCIHDDGHDTDRLVEHRCECGTTWTVRPGLILKREQLEARVAGAKAQIQAIADEFTQSGGMLSAHWVAAKLEHLAKHGCLGPRKGRSCIHPIAGLDTESSAAHHDENGPTRERLIEAGMREARIQGVSPECAPVYARGWADAMRSAEDAVAEAQRGVDGALWTADLNARVEFQGRIAELERQRKAVLDLCDQADAKTNQFMGYVWSDAIRDLLKEDG